LFDRGVIDKFEEMEQDNEFEQYMKLTSNLSATNMHVIDAEGEIRHMNDPLEILVEFYKVRSRYYKLRYDHLLKKTKHEMSVAKSKIKFIKVVSSGNLNMTKMKRSEIVEYLRENKYYDYGEFAYLLDMRMVSMSEEKVALLNEEINKKAEFEKEMRNKVPHDLWVEDLS